MVGKEVKVLVVVEVVITTSSQLQRSFASSVFKAVPSLIEDSDSIDDDVSSDSID